MKAIKESLSVLEKTNKEIEEIEIHIDNLVNRDELAIDGHFYYTDGNFKIPFNVSAIIMRLEKELKSLQLKKVEVTVYIIKLLEDIK